MSLLFSSFFFFVFVLMAHFGDVRPEELKPKNIFLLAGQSNMSGRGGVYNDTKTDTLKWDSVIPPESTPSSDILTLALNNTWVEAREPLHQEIDSLKTCGIGPGMPFAHAILEKEARFGVIGLVPCAIGGTKIHEWQRGTKLYNQLVDRARASVQSGGKIQAMLWYQGESDCGDEYYKFYKERTEKFFNDLRADLNSPDLPIILVVITSSEGDHMADIRHDQQKINLKNLENVDAKGSTFLPDDKHLDTKSEIRIGQKLAHKFLTSNF